MKFFINVLLCTLLLNINIMHAYKPGAKKTTTSSRSTRTPQPSKTSARAQKARIWQEIPAADSYISALNIIRNNMSSDFVIKNNALTPEFINFVTNLNLSVVETKALLEAGINLHATWSGDNQTIKNRLTAFNKTIQSIAPIQQPQPTKPNVPTKVTILEKATQPIIQNAPIAQPAKTIDIIPTSTPIKIVPDIIKPAQPTPQPIPVVTKKIAVQPAILEKSKYQTNIPHQDPKNTPKDLVSRKKNVQEIAEPTPLISKQTPVLTQASSIKDTIHSKLLGKVEKLKDFDIYVGAGFSAAGEAIFFAMEKLDNHNYPIWQRYVEGLLNSYYTQVVKRLRILSNKCQDAASVQKLTDPYEKELAQKMCLNKKKFDALFAQGEGIGGGITGFDEMLYRQKDKQKIIYIAYASNEPITGPFKPKKDINVLSRSPIFSLKDFETAYSAIIICMAIDMMQDLTSPVSTEHRGIFKNPFYEIQDRYKYIALQFHAWAGTVEREVFKKKYATVFPIEPSAELLRKSLKKGDLYLGTDQDPFPYAKTYIDANERKLIEEKFPPIKQDLLGGAPTRSTKGTFEYLHVFDLNALPKYYINQKK